MQDAMVLDAAIPQERSGSVTMQQMPLTFMKSGESARVSKVRGGGEIHHHLENLGFVPGALVKVITEQAGNLIVEVKGSQVALDKASAKKIITG